VLELKKAQALAECHQQVRVACCVLRAACCVLRVACCVLRDACCVLRATSKYAIAKPVVRTCRNNPTAERLVALCSMLAPQAPAKCHMQVCLFFLSATCKFKAPFLPHCHMQV